MESMSIQKYTPMILTGPAGCGKSTWIQSYAKEVNKQLFVCPCRKDRTLRDGRQKLHVWARRTEPAILWLEGADDLTPEAQAFLRRMLETHAAAVLFILECRDSGRLQEPIRSRCIIQRMHMPSWSQLLETFPLHDEDQMSYRRMKQCVFLMREHPEEWEHVCRIREEERAIQLQVSSDTTNVFTFLRNGYHPEHLLAPLLKTHPSLLKDYGQCISVSGSIWAFLGCALDKLHTTPAVEEE